MSTPMRTRVEVMGKMEAAFVGANVKTCGNVHSRGKKYLRLLTVKSLHTSRNLKAFPSARSIAPSGLPLSIPITITSFAPVTHAAV